MTRSFCKPTVPQSVITADKKPAKLWSSNQDLAMAEAKRLFLEHTDKQFSIKEIHKITGVPTRTLITHIYHVKEPWLYEKMQAEQELMATKREVAKLVKESLKPELQRLYGLGVSLLKNSLEAADAKGEKLPIEKLPKLVESLDKMDRWVRLNDGDATSITKNVQESLTEDEIRKEMERLVSIDEDFVDWNESDKIN